MVAFRLILYAVLFAFGALFVLVPLYYLGQAAWVFLEYAVLQLRQRGSFRTASRLAWLLLLVSRVQYALFGHLCLRRRLFAGHAQVISLHAGLLMEAGELGEADRLLDAALAEARRIRVSPRVYGQLLSNRAGLYLTTGAVAEARPLLEKALAMQRQADRQRWEGGRFLDSLGMGQQTWAGNMLLHLGIVYQRLGDYPAAARAYLQARRIFQKQKHLARQPMEAVLVNLGSLYLEKEDLPRAGKVLRHAAGYIRSWDGDRSPKLATALLNLAIWHEKSGRYRQALRLLRRCLKIRAEKLGTGHPAYFHALNNYAGTLYKAGDYDAARPLADRALAGRAAYGEDHPLCTYTLFTRGAIDVADGRPEDALVRFRELIASEQRLIGRLFSVASDAQRLAYLDKARRRMFQFLSLVHTHLPHSAEAVAVAYDLVLSRKALAAEATAARRDAVLGGRYPDLADRLRELSSLRQQIVSRTLAGPGPEGGGAYRRLLDRLQARQAALEVELSRAIPELGLEQRLLAADRRAVASALPAGAALVEFVRFDLFDFLAVRPREEDLWKPARYLAFVVRPEEPEAVRMIDLGAAEPIDRLIRAFRAELVRPDAGSRGMAVLEDDEAPAEVIPVGTGERLRQRVYDPLAGALAGVEHLVLAPDGELAVVPFEVLPGEDGRPLIEDRRFSYLAVGRDLLRAKAAHAEPGPPLVIAGPDFDLGAAVPAVRKRPRRAGPLREMTRSARRFPPLPGTLAEGREVAGWLGVKPVAGPAAVEARMKRSASPRVLHVATHGFFLPDLRAKPGRGFPAGDNPLLRSGLAFAGANTWLAGGAPPADAEDGLLTAEDVTGLDLLGTELVVLSACETGLGEVRAGEGVFGLRRAFQLAGAQTVVMSLWKVPDGPTRELMGRFYRHLLAGLPRAEALRQAQLAVKARHPDPRTWGAFICQGNAGPLPAR
jgi:CHAT domain-containing protein/tetratricopeptide (TPR) repeat protein